MKTWICFVCITLFTTSFSGANGLRIWPGSIRDGAVSIWVGWENGWNNTSTGGNQDAIWLFARHRNPLGASVPLTPSHVSIAHNENYFQCRISSDEHGVWVYASPNHTFFKDSALLTLTFQDQLAASPITVRGIEMVLIPEGPFYVGDSLSNNALFASSSTTKAPIQISSAGSLKLNTVGGIATGSTLDTGFISGDYPLGFNAFFCQKYELSQTQWADFLNDLPEDDVLQLYGLQTLTLPSELVFKRSGLAYQNSQWECSTPYRAAGGLSKQDVWAYLDWACLRPMTETEYEKACRGPNRPIVKELAWGNTLVQAPDSMRDDGTSTERPFGALRASRGWANHARFVGQPYLAGPARQGFAAGPATDRVEAGAGYYGCFELSGNVWEICARLEPHSSLTHVAGDGVLTHGKANQSGWSDVRAIVRGGGHASVVSDDISYPFRDIAVSDRFYIDYDASQRRSTTGGRGVRSW